jgi:hypothetical protein
VSGRAIRACGALARRAGRRAGLALLGVFLAGATAWGAGVLVFAGPGGPRLRGALAATLAGIGLAALGSLALRRWRWPPLVALAVALALVGARWAAIQPSNERDWSPEVAVLPRATTHGDLVTIHGIRDFEYRSETDFTPRYHERTFDLRRLDRVDLVAAYWMGPAIAHLFLTFGFGDEHLAISIEARKERDEGYSSLAGFFRQYELAYVVADERDVIRLRTSYRKDPPEEVYLFRLAAPVENARRVFLDYLREINELRGRPRFYNTLTANCTNVILLHAQVNPDPPRWSWKILLSGYAPEYLYEAGRLDRTLPFAELKRRSLVNAPARAADRAPDFSRRIRAGLP